MKKSDEREQLPKLPLPPLQNTLKKYEKTLRPLLSDQEHEKVQKIIEKFGGSGGIGVKLQLYLANRREKVDNWAYEYWLNDMYLNYREPIPVNSNPGMVFPPRKFTTILDVARFTSRLIDAALDHKEILDRRALPVERAASREPGQPLCMAQYYRLLGASRLPGRRRDSQYVTPTPKKGDKPPDSEHIIVICRSQLYCVPVQAEDD
nr:unnamed protein product [Callosobruchus chinensis]